jgi:hypothetical protein
VLNEQGFQFHDKRGLHRIANLLLFLAGFLSLCARLVLDDHSILLSCKKDYNRYKKKIMFCQWNMDFVPKAHALARLLVSAIELLVQW